MDNPGIYIHVPFCTGKCPYCDFYSLTAWDDNLLDRYTERVVEELELWHRGGSCSADTLYFGGGTPPVLGGKRIGRIISAADRIFGLENAEITLEVNPGGTDTETLRDFAAAGGNRVSVGMQSDDDSVLRFLGRRHTHADTAAVCEAVRGAGIDNISVDGIIGLPGQDTAALVRFSQEAFRLGASHVSAYMLKLEPGTPFYERADELGLPDEDAAAEQYLAACQTFALMGWKQYEISNFSVPGRESRHNLKYWNAVPVIGIGPAAHSFYLGKRRYYPRSLADFMDGMGGITDEEDGGLPPGSEQEYIMLRLRLNEGVNAAKFRERFGYPPPDEYARRAAALPPALVRADEKGIRLTSSGFLLSNTLTARILYD